MKRGEDAEEDGEEQREAERRVVVVVGVAGTGGHVAVLVGHGGHAAGWN